MCPFTVCLASIYYPLLTFFSFFSFLFQIFFSYFLYSLTKYLEIRALKYVPSVLCQGMMVPCGSFSITLARRLNVSKHGISIISPWRHIPLPPRLDCKEFFPMSSFTPFSSFMLLLRTSSPHGVLGYWIHCTPCRTFRSCLLAVRICFY